MFKEVADSSYVVRLGRVMEQKSGHGQVRRIVPSRLLR